MPSVSIVLPNYNHARFLDIRIRSLLKQTYSDFELIILDDASTDKSREVISAYTYDQRIQTVFYQVNSGATYQRWNDGAKLARGEYLIFAGADDDCHPTMLEKLVSRLEAHVSVGLVYCQSRVVDAEGKFINLLTDLLIADGDIDDATRWSRDFVASGQFECQYLAGTNPIGSASAVLMRRKLFEDVEGFDVTMKLAADWKLWASMLLRSDVAYVAEPLNYYRFHIGAVTWRMIADKKACDVEECYQAGLFVAQHCCVPEEMREVARDNLARMWVNKILTTRGGIPRERNRAIYRIARRLDPKMKCRLRRIYYVRTMAVLARYDELQVNYEILQDRYTHITCLRGILHEFPRAVLRAIERRITWFKSNSFMPQK